MLIGDVLAVIAVLAGMAFSAWAVLLGSAMLFQAKAEISRSLIQFAPFRTFFLGFVLLFVIGFISIALINVPLVLVKFFGWSGILLALSLASLGASGLVLLLGERLKEFDSNLTRFAALSRAGIFIVAAGLVPLLGLFIVLPCVLSIGIGCAVQSLFMRKALHVNAETI